MASMGQFRFSTLTKQLPTPAAATHSRHEPTSSPFAVSFPLNNNSLLLRRLPKVRILNPLSPPKPEILAAAAGGGGGNNGSGNSGGGGGGGGGSGGAGGDSDSDSDSESGKSLAGLGILGLFLAGWRDRVAADPQFPFKVLMEELVGVTANVLGDMASRPNFGLNELDFVFSTMIVGCIVNFTLMYLLAPAASAASSNLPWIFSNCPPSHMFQPGSFSLGNRIGTFAYKGATFAAVGFAAGLVGTAISNGLIKMRKKLDPNFETPNKAPPTVLNALTWAVHMGFNSNLRYQSLNGVEFVLAKSVSPLVFKSSVVVLRCLNNVLGGMTFVMLARLTGSQQSVEEEGKPAAVVEEVELGEGGDKIKEE